MRTWLGTVLDVEGRPAAVTAAATLGVVAGGATLVGATVVAGAVVTSGGTPWGPALAALVQVSAGVLLLVGGARLATGAGRGVLFRGIALALVTCALHAWYALAEVASDRDDAALAPVLLGIAGTFAAAVAVTLWLALRPSAAWRLAGPSTP